MNMTIVEKEIIPTLNFPEGEILTEDVDKKERAMRLNRAIRLGNNHKRKVKITFQDDEGVKRVETTIWAVTEQNIVLKAGVNIPIERVLTVAPY